MPRSAQPVIICPSQDATPCRTKRCATWAAAFGSRSGLLVRHAISNWLWALSFWPDTVDR
jgi:hypothetical protein